MSDQATSASRCQCGMWDVCQLPDQCPQAAVKLERWQLRNTKPADQLPIDDRTER